MENIKHVRVSLCGYKNIVPTYSSTDISTQAYFLDMDLGMSTKTTVTDDECCVTSFDFIIECDIDSAKSLDNLISKPLQFKVYEHPRICDPKLMEQLDPVHKRLSQEALASSSESAINIIEAFAKTTIDRSTFVVSDCNKSLQDSKSEKSDIPFPTNPVLLGIANLDFLPLFQGKMSFNESLLIHKPEQFYDDALVPVNVMPCLMVEVNIDERTWLPQKDTNVLNITIESIHNLSFAMSADMNYSVSTYIPNAHSELEHTIIDGGTWKNSANLFNMKQWPLAQNSEVLRDTTYRVSDSINTIHNKKNMNLRKLVDSNEPRIEFNVLKRNYFMGSALRLFYKNLKAYRHLPLELCVSKTGVPFDGINFLHLMADVDLCTLLYPGVSTCRTVCPLKTFHKKEIMEKTGLTTSYFLQRVKDVVVVAEKKDNKSKSAKGNKGSATKSSKGSPTKSNKGSATKSNKGSATKSECQPIPSPKVEEPPSQYVYSNNGEITFIVIEVELQTPLVPKKPLEDLTHDLLNLLPPRPKLSKFVISARLAIKQYRDGIKQITEDILSQHDKFLVDTASCPCVQFGIRDTKYAFIAFLHKSGIYQTYLSSFTKIASTAIKEKFPYINDTNPNNRIYQNFIGEVYAAFAKETNDMINHLSKSGVEVRAADVIERDWDPSLLYGEEACEIGAILLADRYFLERICQSKKKAAQWFDYAVFNLQIRDEEKAFECVRRSLLEDDKFKYSLLMFAVLLYDRNQNEEAETCFLTAMLLHPTWLEEKVPIVLRQICIENNPLDCGDEKYRKRLQNIKNLTSLITVLQKTGGWATMHLFYSCIGNSEGADLCLEMAHKYLNTAKSNDYIANHDKLVWTTSICPNQIFFRSAVLLIKMHLYKFAEKSLTHAKDANLGVYHYLLGVIQYYRQNYQHALIHAKEAEELHGPDYAVNSLMGHCYLALEKLEDAKKEYMRVLESFNRPDDIHLVYVYLALISERTGNKHFAKNMLLSACKCSPTPYTWLGAGLIYYAQKDLISAEQCLLQANICDNRLAEVWGYLVLINLELTRYSEAELCYKQIKKNKLENEDLAKKIEEAWKWVNKTLY